MCITFKNTNNTFEEIKYVLFFGYKLYVTLQENK